MTRTVMAIAVVALLTLHTVPTAQSKVGNADWPQWRGPQRDGRSAANAPAWPATLRKRWEVPVGLGHASPVVQANRVFVHSREGEREVLRALDMTNGKELWRTDYPAPYTMNSAARGHGPGPKSTPVVSGSRVFTLGISGILSAFDVATGKVLWRLDAPAAPPEFGTAMSPLVDGATLFVHLGAHDKGALSAFDAASGKVRWRWTGDGPSYASPIIATFGGRRHLVTQSENAVIGLDAATGALLWRVPFTTNYDQNSVTPVVFGDLVIYSGLDGGTSALRISGSGDTWRATPMWKNDQVSMYMSSPVLIPSDGSPSGTLYGLSHRSRGQFFALDVASGRTLWTTPGREGENASLISTGGWLLLSTTNGELIVARAGTEKFAELRRYRVAESAVWAHPALIGDTILVKDLNTLISWGL